MGVKKYSFIYHAYVSIFGYLCIHCAMPKGSDFKPYNNENYASVWRSARETCPSIYESQSHFFQCVTSYYQAFLLICKRESL